MKWIKIEPHDLLPDKSDYPIIITDGNKISLIVEDGQGCIGDMILKHCVTHYISIPKIVLPDRD